MDVNSLSNRFGAAGHRRSVRYIDFYYIDGRARVAARIPVSTRGLVVLQQPTSAEVRNGLPASFPDRQTDASEVTETQLAGVVGIARQTLVRRQRHGILRRDEGDRAATANRHRSVECGNHRIRVECDDPGNA